LTPIEYCSKLLNSKNPSMVQMYWTQTLIIILTKYKNELE